MKHIVSFETAKALKEAGYPQPEFETGQIWYNSFGAKTVIGRMHVSDESPHQVSFDCFAVDSGRCERLSPIHEGAFYAPSATEIMEHKKMRLCVCDCWGYAPVVWKCTDHESRKIFSDERHSEAAAKMFINLTKSL